MKIENYIEIEIGDMLVVCGLNVNKYNHYFSQYKYLPGGKNKKINWKAYDQIQNGSLAICIGLHFKDKKLFTIRNLIKLRELFILFRIISDFSLVEDFYVKITTLASRMHYHDNDVIKFDEYYNTFDPHTHNTNLQFCTDTRGTCEFISNIEKATVPKDTLEGYNLKLVK